MKRTAVFSNWEWVYDGKIDYIGLSNVYTRSACCSKIDAFWSPLILFLKDLLTTGRVSKKDFRNGVGETDGLIKSDKVELVD